MFGVSKYYILPTVYEHSEWGSLCLIGLFYLCISALSLSVVLAVSLTKTHEAACACTYGRAYPRTLHSRLIHIHPLGGTRSRLFFASSVNSQVEVRIFGVTGARRRPSKRNRPISGGASLLALSLSSLAPLTSPCMSVSYC